MLLCGKSGSDKTTILSRAAEWASTRPADGRHLVAANFYCSYNDAGSQKAVHVLGLLIVQLASRDPSALEPLKAQNNKQGFGSQQLEEAIASPSITTKSIQLVLDALNESSERKAICQSLLRLISERPNIKCLLSSTSHLSNFRSRMHMPSSQHHSARLGA
jgi:hypothetical protein